MDQASNLFVPNHLFWSQLSLPAIERLKSALENNFEVIHAKSLFVNTVFERITAYFTADSEFILTCQSSCFSPQKHYILTNFFQELFNVKKKKIMIFFFRRLYNFIFPFSSGSNLNQKPVLGFIFFFYLLSEWKYDKPQLDVCIFTSCCAFRRE